ncbi:zinc finger protein [Loa loa]|uniref:Zinc finger protein n=1 Tax=Loa loa TaxID=7209 RepID=A0A1I7W1L2_LOALO|nr:zinc finger protein [Loa loa]EJD73401.1 zinc finger protein [Loa loa]
MKHPTSGIKMKLPTSKQSEGNSPKETKVAPERNIQSVRLTQVKSGSNAKHAERVLLSHRI